MTQNPSPKLRTTSWVTGQSGNPAGKPLGTRSAFSKAFVADLTVAWQEHGVGVLQKVARSDPTRFLGVCASVLPKDVAVSIQEQTPGNLDPQDWAIVMELLQAVKETVPNAADRRPGEVLSFARDAIRSAGAKTIDDCSENSEYRSPDSWPKE